VTAPLEETIGHALRERDQTMATAESCTGGLLGHRITGVPGCSAYYPGGAVTYSNAAKVDLIGVRTDTLAAEGAVSEATAREMAEGVRKRFQADYGLSITGIAGPTGGTVEKPVGLVYIGVAGPHGATVRRQQFRGDRAAVKQQSVEAALALFDEILRS